MFHRSKPVFSKEQWKSAKRDRSPRRKTLVLATTLSFERLEARWLLSASPTIDGPFLVTPTTTGTAIFPATAMDAAGDFVVVWQNNNGIFAQRYDASGAAEGTQVQVSGDTPLNFNPSVAMDAAGDFVVAWTSPDAVKSYSDVMARQFNAAGQPQGSELLVSSWAASPSVAMDAAGDFGIAWVQYAYQDMNMISAARYSSDGVTEAHQSPVSWIDQRTKFVVQYPSLAMDAAGDMVVVWSQNGDSMSGVYDSRLTAGGEIPQGPVSSSAATDRPPSVAMDPAGDFVVAYSVKTSASTYANYVRTYSADFIQQGNPQLVTTSTSSQGWPVVAMQADGEFVVDWQDDNETILAQRFSAGATAQGSAFQVGELTDPNFNYYGIEYYAVAGDASGDFVTTWDQGGDRYDPTSVYGSLTTVENMLVVQPGTPNDHIGIEFTDANNFTVISDGQTTSYSTTQYSKVVIEGPVGAFAEVVFQDGYHSFAATQTLRATRLATPGFEFDAENVQDAYVYASGSARSMLATSTHSSYFVESLATDSDSPANYSYLADPDDGIFSELSGFTSINAAGMLGASYAYIYSSSGAKVTATTPGVASASTSSISSTLSSFPQIYVVGASDGTDKISMNCNGGAFVSTPIFSYVNDSLPATNAYAATNCLVGALYAASVTASASAKGQDTAFFYSYSKNVFTGQVGASSLAGSALDASGTSYPFSVEADGFKSVAVLESGSGSDVANLVSPGNGTFVGSSTVDTLSVGGTTITVDTNIEQSDGRFTPAYSDVSVTGHHDGTDAATLSDLGTTNVLVAQNSTATLSTPATGSAVQTIAVSQFGNVTATQQDGHLDTLDEGAIDYALTTVGTWSSGGA